MAMQVYTSQAYYSTPSHDLRTNMIRACACSNNSLFIVLEGASVQERIHDSSDSRLDFRLTRHQTKLTPNYILNKY